MTDTALFTASEHIAETIASYEARLTLVKARYDAFHPEMHSRRSVADGYHDVARGLRSAKSWQAGDYDRSYAGPHPSFGTTLQHFRDHYADDSLRGALHHLLWTEHYAGLRDRESIRELDPWNKH